MDRFHWLTIHTRDAFWRIQLNMRQADAACVLTTLNRWQYFSV